MGTTSQGGSGLALIALVVLATLTRVRGSKRWVIFLTNPVRKLFFSPHHSSTANLLYPLLFFLITVTNILGVYTYNQHLLLTGVVSMLVSIVLIFWIFSYRRFVSRGWHHLTWSLIVDLVYPVLSLLLRNIEILTHAFRPITLIARIWVNMWVGHRILSMISFTIVRRVSRGLKSWSSLILIPLAQGFLLLYE